MMSHCTDRQPSTRLFQDSGLVQFRRGYGRWMGLLLLLTMLSGGCKGGTSVGARPSAERASAPSAAADTSGAAATVSGSQLAQEGGLCDVNRTVRSPEPDTAEWVIWRAYVLAQQPDNDQTFGEFVALFPAGKDPRQIREFYWNNLRKNVGKYVLAPGGGDFVICRTVAKSDGTQYYIRPSGTSHPPPLRVGKIDGAWKFTFFTPF